MVWVKTGVITSLCEKQTGPSAKLVRKQDTRSKNPSGRAAG